MKITLPQTYKLQLSRDDSKILVYNRDKSVTHEFDADSVPHLIDYISDDPYFDFQTFAHGYIQDNMLVIVNRVAPENW